MNKLLKADENFDGLPPWMAAMRKAVLDTVTQEDVAEIVKSQIKRAKEGDQAAIKFVFGQLLGGDTFKGATFVQNNYHGEDRPDKPTKARAGSADRVDMMRRRMEAGLPLCNGEDGDGGSLE
jgi:hypothetical protein